MYRGVSSVVGIAVLLIVMSSMLMLYMQINTVNQAYSREITRDNVRELNKASEDIEAIYFSNGGGGYIKLVNKGKEDIELRYLLLYPPGQEILSIELNLPLPSGMERNISIETPITPGDGTRMYIVSSTGNFFPVVEAGEALGIQDDITVTSDGRIIVYSDNPVSITPIPKDMVLIEIRDGVTRWYQIDVSTQSIVSSSRSLLMVSSGDGRIKILRTNPNYRWYIYVDGVLTDVLMTGDPLNALSYIGPDYILISNRIYYSNGSILDLEGYTIQVLENGIYAYRTTDLEYLNKPLTEIIHVNGGVYSRRYVVYPTSGYSVEGVSIDSTGLRLIIRDGYNRFIVARFRRIGLYQGYELYNMTMTSIMYSEYVDEAQYSRWSISGAVNKYYAGVPNGSYRVYKGVFSWLNSIPVTAIPYYSVSASRLSIPALYGNKTLSLEALFYWGVFLDGIYNTNYSLRMYMDNQYSLVVNASAYYDNYDLDLGFRRDITYPVGVNISIYLVENIGGVSRATALVRRSFTYQKTTTRLYHQIYRILLSMRRSGTTLSMSFTDMMMETASLPSQTVYFGMYNLSLTGVVDGGFIQIEMINSTYVKRSKWTGLPSLALVESVLVDSGGDDALYVGLDRPYGYYSSYSHVMNTGVDLHLFGNSTILYRYVYPHINYTMVLISPYTHIGLYDSRDTWFYIDVDTDIWHLQRPGEALYDYEGVVIVDNGVEYLWAGLYQITGAHPYSLLHLPEKILIVIYAGGETVIEVIDIWRVLADAGVSP